MEPATTAALIGAGSQILSGIGSGLLQDSPERNVRRTSGTFGYPLGFMEGFGEMHPYPGITGPPPSSGWQPPQVEQQVGIQHDGNIPLSWIKQSYMRNRPDKMQDLSRWFRAHGIDENAEYVTPEQWGRMVEGGFPGMSGVSQGAITSAAADIGSRQRLGDAAKRFYAGARGEAGGQQGSPQQAGLPFSVPEQDGGSFEMVAQTASSLFGNGQGAMPGQGTTPGQLGALPGGSVQMPAAQPPVPPMPQEAPPSLPAPSREGAPPASQESVMRPPQPMPTAQAPTQPFPGTDPLAMAPQVAQAVQEQIQTDPLQPATENTYVQQLLAALQQDLNTPFVG